MRTIRPLRLDEVQRLIDWAAAEGWNPGLADAEAFYAADPKGFLGAFVDDQMVAGISAVAYGTSFGFIGLYICHPDWRGQGHGKAVWDAGMARLAGRTIGLDGVPEQQANYGRMGFRKVYDTVRMTGELRGGDAAAVAAARLAEILVLDRECFPEDRTAFLQQWLAAPRQARALRAGREIIGYGVIRECREGAQGRSPVREVR